MPFKFTPAAADALTAVGDTGGFGVATVTSTANFYPDATVWLRNGSTTGEYIVTSILSATTMGLRAVRPPYGGQTYGNSTLASWGVGTTVNQEAFQVVDVELSNLEKLPKP